MQRETHLLAPFASRSSTSAGRHYPEPEHASRCRFQRDRDRIIHSRCFRRLEYKTQVFTRSSCDHYRTRLTHSVEVAAVARTMARIFQVNEDLTECIALAHDIGHAPFGHAGENELNQLMADAGGFDHNLQSLRWVDILDIQYPDFPGLNLSWEVRAGLMKHEAAKPDAILDNLPIGPRQSIEAQIADIADDITYYAHDTDDALLARILTEELLETQELWRLATERTDARYSGLDRGQHIRITIRNLLDLLIEDIVTCTLQNIETYQPRSVTEVMQAPVQIVACSPAMQEHADAFRAFLYKNVYFSQSIKNQAEIATAMLRHLFQHYCQHPEHMGKKAQSRLAEDGLKRAVCDYLSGFTDKYVFQEHTRYFR
ncbi:MAG: deoxyguanosinetriphosphate triphosphohydrolase [Kiritimatiellia bacterium]